MSGNVTVVGKRRFDYQGKVYDLNVEEEHNYTVEDVCVHNSAAGSEVCYMLGITGIDPIKNGLMFERFLNKARFNFPDIDLDIQGQTLDGHLGKDILIDSLQDIFPFSAQVVNEMRATTVVLFKQLAKVYGIEFYESNKVSTDKTVADKYLKEDFYTGWLQEQVEALGLEFDSRWAEFEKHIDFCYKYGGNKYGDNAAGLLWGSSIHASAVIFYPFDDGAVLPVSSQGVIYRGHDLEKMGFIKYDLLSLDALVPIKKFIPKIEAITGRPFDWEDNSDPATWKVFQDGDTDFVFQFASPGMKRCLTTVKPDNIDKLAELNSLYRPGCIEAGLLDNYLANDWTDEQKVVGEFLKEEFGEEHSVAMIFQEDIMKVVEKMAGFSLADADLVRRAMQRKEKDTMDSYKQQFLDGFDTNKYGNIAETVWNTIEAFATYTFNKSHSVAYSCIAYWEAFIYAHFKNEYLQYLLNIDKQKDKIVVFLSKDHKIEFPNINSKNDKYIVEDDVLYLPTMYFGGETPAEYLMSLDTTKNKMITKYGVLDSFCPDRKGMKELFTSLDKKKVNNLTETQMNHLVNNNDIDGMLKDLRSLDLIDYEEDRGIYNVKIKKARSVKEVTLSKKLTRDILKYNCQEDIRAFGIVRKPYVDDYHGCEVADRLVEVWDNIPEEVFEINVLDIIKEKHVKALNESNLKAYKEKYNQQLEMFEEEEFRCVFKKAEGNNKYPKIVLVFGNQVAQFPIARFASKETKSLFKSIDKNTPLKVKLQADFYLTNKNKKDKYEINAKVCIKEAVTY